MKINKSFLGVVVLFFGFYGLLALSFVHAHVTAVVEDDFNNYSVGSLLGQGGWTNYANGQNFTVQGMVTVEGSKAIFVNAAADSVISKTGTPLSDGKQSIYVRTQNRAGWSSYVDGNAQIRILKGAWGGSAENRSFIGITFKKEGNVAFYNGSAYENFATYNDNEWTLLEVEWRSSDKSSRFRINSGSWTSWKPIAGGGTYTDLDGIGFDFISSNTSGGVYYDFLSSDSTLPTPTPHHITSKIRITPKSGIIDITILPLTSSVSDCLSPQNKTSSIGLVFDKFTF